MNWRDRIAAIMTGVSLSPQDQAFADMRRSPNIEDRREQPDISPFDYAFGMFPPVQPRQPFPPTTQMSRDLGEDEISKMQTNAALKAAYRRRQ